MISSARAIPAILLLLGLFLNEPAGLASEANTALLLRGRGNVTDMRSKVSNELWLDKTNNLSMNQAVRTFANSAAKLRIYGKDISLGPVTIFELEEQSTGSTIITRLREGFLYYFSRDKKVDLEIKNGFATAAAHGTEFAVSVVDGVMTISVFEGMATLKNDGEKQILPNQSGEVNTTRLDQPRLKAVNVIQWWLYFPAIIDPSELALTDEEAQLLAKSLEAYRAGDVQGALRELPPTVEAEVKSDSAKAFIAGLMLAAGQSEKAETILKALAPGNGLAQGLRAVVAAVKHLPFEIAQEGDAKKTASEAIGISYYFQSIHRLGEAMKAAQEALLLSPDFGFSLTRMAELEFGAGEIQSARQHVARALELSPLNVYAHTLDGFLLMADGELDRAEAAFGRAIALDPAFGDPWLGRGLTRFRRGRGDDIRQARADLQMAASTEAQRSIFRSYLGKAMAVVGETQNATNEFARAIELDAKDPTPWFYSALLEQEEFRINSAIGKLEESTRLNDNRALYRSRFLLDQDRAVRSVNLAAIYEEAGLGDVSVLEASRAVTADYANYSAHLFLANSYNSQRDPSLVNLRYESAAFSEYLLANLLSPVGGTRLSPYVSQQEYTRLFERDRIGFSSQTTYLSRGDWNQQASQYGWVDNTAYALDAYYYSRNGEAPNNDLIQKAFSLQAKQQITPNDSIYVQGIVSDSVSGDVRQFYNPASADPDLRVKDRQRPNLFLGYHHQWSLGMHTLFLASRLQDRFTLNDQNLLIRGVVRDNSGAVIDTVQGIAQSFGFPDPSVADGFDSFNYRSEFDAYSVELQQIAVVRDHTLIGGIRYQTGETETSAESARISGQFPPYGFGDFISTQLNSTDLNRLSLYAYDQWQLRKGLWLTTGLTYDYLEYPKNIVSPPISNLEQDKEQLSPKAGLTWHPQPETTVRGAYSRSLGGLFYDTSIRLEPVQVAGFSQAYRSLIPESVEGAISGSEFQTFDLGLHHRFPTKTHLTLNLGLLQSEAESDVGVFDFDPTGLLDAAPSQLSQELEFEEQSAVIALNQLLGENWSLGARYRLAQADLKTMYPGVSETLIPHVHQRAILHELSLFAILNHPTGFFGSSEGVWRGQETFHYTPALPDESFWQMNLAAGFRFPKRRAEIVFGLLNATDQDYRLNPLNYYLSAPRGRTFVASLKINL